jgi:hypothetical protein
VVEDLYSASPHVGQVTNAKTAGETRLRCLGVTADAGTGLQGQALGSRKLFSGVQSSNRQEEALSVGRANLLVDQQGTSTDAARGCPHNEVPSWQVMSAGLIIPAMAAFIMQVQSRGSCIWRSLPFLKVESCSLAFCKLCYMQPLKGLLSKQVSFRIELCIHTKSRDYHKPHPLNAFFPCLALHGCCQLAITFQACTPSLLSIYADRSRCIVYLFK